MLCSFIFYIFSKWNKIIQFFFLHPDYEVLHVFVFSHEPQTDVNADDSGTEAAIYVLPSNQPPVLKSSPEM